MWWIPLLLAANAVVLYYFLSLSPEFGELVESKKHEFLARINGLLFVVYLLTMRMFTTTPEGAMEQVTQVVAYMVYDCAHAPFYARGYDYYIHHIVYFLIYFLVIPSSSGQRASHFYDAACILESSAPILSIGWFMDALGYPMDTFHQIARVVLFLIWTCIRIVYFPYWVGTTLESKDIVYTLPFMALNCYWFWLLIKKATKTPPSPVAESPDREGATPAHSNPREPRT